VYANVYFKTTIIKQNIKIILIAGVPSSQALPGFLITAPPSVCVPDVIGVLTGGFKTKKKKLNCTSAGHRDRLLRLSSQTVFRSHCFFLLLLRLIFNKHPPIKKLNQMVEFNWKVILPKVAHEIHVTVVTQVTVRTAH